MALDILEANPTMGKSVRNHVAPLLRFLKDSNAIKRRINFYHGESPKRAPLTSGRFGSLSGCAWTPAPHWRNWNGICGRSTIRTTLRNSCLIFAEISRARPTPHNTQGLRDVGIWGNVGLLLKMLRLTLAHVRYEDDIRHDGVYRPGARDHAEHFRGALFNHLVTECSGEEAHRAMMELSADTAIDKHTRGVLRVYARRCAEKDVKSSVWKPAEVVAFANDMTPPLRDPNKFFQWFLFILDNIKSNWEGGNYSPKDQIHSEKDAQISAARDLENISGGKFTVIRENDVIDDKEPDLQIQPCGGDSVVSVEMKIANKWSFRQLQDALETQLPQYLCDPKARHGILLLVYKSEKKWKISSRLVNFAELTEALGNQAKELAGKMEGVDDIRVIGIDLSKAEKQNPPPRSPRKKTSKAPSAKPRKRKT